MPPGLTDGMQRPLRVAVVACEASGDVLGAGLLRALQARCDTLSAWGMAGPRMRAAGCQAWHGIEEVSVMGLVEVLPHLPRLLRLRARLAERIVAAKPDVFVGIDSPDFNLPIARRVRAAGVATVQYVSPQVWAWRQSRVTRIQDAVDRMLCVLPFEKQFFADHGVDADFVGHPLADEIEPDEDPAAARLRIGAAVDRPLVALLPGSRGSEVSRLAAPFLGTAEFLRNRRSDLQFAIALANDESNSIISAELGRIRLAERPLMLQGRTRDVIAAADVVLTASGTATLETLLLGRRMVVAHRIVPLTYWLVRRLGVSRLPNFSLPNLLAGRRIVPEFVQNRVTAEVLGPALLEVLEDRLIDSEWREQFARIRRNLKRDASQTAAASVIDLAMRDKDGEGPSEHESADRRS
jgi:lipid-A-disaccharide synthase